MIIFPFEFREVPRAPGYYYNVKDKQVYSIKSGSLKALVKRGKWYHPRLGLLPPNYQVSIKGQKRTLTDEYLVTLEHAKHNALTILKY